MTYDMLYESKSTLRSATRFAALRQLWFNFWQRRADRKLALTLAQLDERLLRDIGIEPIDVIDALNGRPGPSVLFNPMRRENHE